MGLGGFRVFTDIAGQDTHPNVRTIAGLTWHDMADIIMSRRWQY